MHMKQTLIASHSFCFSLPRKGAWSLRRDSRSAFEVAERTVSLRDIMDVGQGAEKRGLAFAE